MADDRRYELALTAGLRLLDELRKSPDAPEHVVLGNLVFAILDAINESESQDLGNRLAASLN